MIWRRVVPCVLIAIVAFAGCGGGGDDANEAEGGASAAEENADGDALATAAPAEGEPCTTADEQAESDDGITHTCLLVDDELRWTVLGVDAAGEDGEEADAAPACTYMSYGEVEPPLESSVGAFTHVPFNPSDLSLITNGEETNDPRFSYQWIKDQGASIPIYAPADGVLVRIRHKARRPGIFDSDDFDLFFLVSCNTLVRFNHITEPRADIKATYQHGDLPSLDFNADGTITEYDDRQIPSEMIRVKAGEELGRTSGTPGAHDFDFQIAVDNATVCPFSVFEEPAKSDLMNMLGPLSASPNGPPQPGYPCSGYGAQP